MEERTIKIEVLFPEFANLFGDMMNVRYLEKCIPGVEIIETGLNDVPAFTKEWVSMVYMGPMTEHQQELVIQTLSPYREDLKRCIEENVVFLLTGNAFETFGSYIENEDGSRMKGLEFFPLHAKRDMFHRYNSLIMGEYEGITLVGFKAQFSHSYGDNSNCGFYKVLRGDGICPGSTLEGVHKNNFFGTYTVGPFLVQNPLFAKYLMKQMGVKEPRLAYEESIMEAYEKRLAEFRAPKLRYQ